MFSQESADDVDNVEPQSENSESGISGYRIYSPSQKRRTMINELPEFYPDFPEDKYDIIYCDPPWDYGGKMQFDKSSKKSENKNWQRDIFISAANFKYPTIKTKIMEKLPVQDICADNCLLFMWVTNPHLAQGIELGLSWGFEYKTVGFVWDKCNHNPGQYNYKSLLFRIKALSLHLIKHQ